MKNHRKKLKVKNYDHTCFACPSQWDIYTEDGKYIYARFRFGHLSVIINPFTSCAKSLLEWDDINDWNGVMSTDELQELTKDILEW